MRIVYKICVDVIRWIASLYDWDLDMNRYQRKYPGRFKQYLSIKGAPGPAATLATVCLVFGLLGSVSMLLMSFTTFFIAIHCLYKYRI